jgi:hypothetical protein
VAWFAHLHQVGFQPTFPIWGSICGGYSESVKPCAHPQCEKVLKRLKKQFEKFYTLNQIVVAWFAHLHQVGFQPTLKKIKITSVVVVMV